MIAKSITYFILAGLCEIGGGYLVWLWLREGRPMVFGVFGATILVLYGVIPTLQAAHFGRVYAAYGGVFIVLSILWGWKIDGIAPILAIVSVRQKIVAGSVMMVLFALGHCLPIAVAESSTALVRRVTENSAWQGAGLWFRRGAGVVTALLGAFFIAGPFVNGA